MSFRRTMNRDDDDDDVNYRIYQFEFKIDKIMFWHWRFSAKIHSCYYNQNFNDNILGYLYLHIKITNYLTTHLSLT